MAAHRLAAVLTHRRRLAGALLHCGQWRGLASTGQGHALALAALTNAFRSRGHLSATLDPLRRTPRGPWLAEDASSSGLAYQDPTVAAVLGVLDGRRGSGGGQDSALASDLAAALGLPPLAAASPPVDLSAPGTFPGGPPPGAATATLPTLASTLASAWSGALTAQVDHLPPDQQAWLVSRLECRPPRNPAARRATLRLLARAAAFESFLGKHFPRSKRFGVEGLDALIPAVAALAERCAGHGLARLHIGLAHRGRLNLLQNVLGAPAGQMFAEMEATQSEFAVGDVKYHLGRTARLAYPRPGGVLVPAVSAEENTRPPTTRRPPSPSLHLSVAPNPSHLEAVGPVVLGLVRAQQDRLAGGASAVAGLLLHGDASFAGLGIVPETLSLGRLPGWSVGGTLHIVANNGVGFTTDPAGGRSGPHPTDVALHAGGPIPILHACADDPDAVLDGAALAADWRAAWGSDVILDIVGYRRHGHNELDDPTPAQPVTVAAVAAHPPVVDLYAAVLGAEGVYPDAASAAAAAASWAGEAAEEYAAEHAAFAAGAYAQTADDWVRSSWQGAALEAVSAAAGNGGSAGPADQGGITQRQEPTGLPLATLAWVGRRVTSLPPGFAPTPAAAAALAARRAQVEGPAPRVDFATAEALAFGSLALHKGAEVSGGAAARGDAALPPDAAASDDDDSHRGAGGLNEGAYAVRLAGQDAERGTFGQRHASMREAGTGRRCVPLGVMRPGAQEAVNVWNSPLNEYSCLAFEYGYSLGAAGRALCVWEAQFGDFANGAQAAIDLFVAAGEERWGAQSGIVLLLPHGYEGQGPDHSSARLERFLQLCNDDGDALPGDSPRERQEVDAAFDALARECAAAAAAGGSGDDAAGGSPSHHPVVDRARAAQLLDALGAATGGGAPTGEAASAALWTELGLPSSATPIDRAAWRALMTRFLRRNAEARANLFVVVPSTPAQLFHALRRQLNRPRPKPCIIASPKWLHVHSAATSALADLGADTHFRRVIEDGSPGDNTRHRAAHPGTGASFSVPPESVRRVVLCCGPIFYHLNAARRARRVRDVAIVRVEQLSPFPHDLVAAAVGKYAPFAEVVWLQDEPKNQGAWRHVQPRINLALKPRSSPAGEEGRSVRARGSGDRPQAAGGGGGGGAGRAVRFIGRPPSGTTATASMAIHQSELRGILDAALAPPA